jgi:UrcA family protein
MTHSPSISSLAVCLALSAAPISVLLSGNAQGAESSDGVRSVTVNDADLNLSNQAGVATLYRRIQAAANSVCGPKPTRDVRAIYARRNCYGNAVANAVADVDIRQLAALHAEHTLMASTPRRPTSH